ncbi:hypothetical protein DAPPUDRAFT_332413 [Daphnia pulex]|uniref:Uncharacterized protein n=1 Tax=Daphnia pulex TaxID=6669 RepID=E9HPW5_DAPPU|nr:hypothetical protein DAPPUDRAFT_332413 [Daphnia pulex]|eukprot:EFX66230.1 hypothetical protein DAPPUDRAFT_332413 [Daphnia pulex]
MAIFVSICLDHNKSEEMGVFELYFATEVRRLLDDADVEPYTAAAKVWSLVVILQYMLFGRHPSCSCADYTGQSTSTQRSSLVDGHGVVESIIGILGSSVRQKRRGYYQPSVVASPEVRKSTHLERTGLDIEESVYNCNTPENHPNWQRNYGNRGSTSFNNMMRLHHLEEALDNGLKLHIPLLHLCPFNTTTQFGFSQQQSIDCNVCLFSKILKTMSSRDQISKMLMSKLFTNSLCSKIQWKKRGNDRRPGFGHLTNLIAVMGVIINIIREINKAPKVDFKELIGTIQTARRILSFELKNK